jgi:2-haloacid dehalogenase
MTGAMRGLGAPDDEVAGLAEALPSWGPFPEVRPALEETRARGWKLAILSNTDRDFIDASMERIGVPFELAIVASEIGSYKPGHAHWARFFEETGAPRETHVHVAQSHFHDVVPASELGLRTVWINRYGEQREPPPTRELADLSRLPETLDELVAA